MPAYYALFEHTKYSPWVVLNFKFKKSFDSKDNWQNDMIGFDDRLQGFVNSNHQQSDQTVLTMYMCYDYKMRKMVKSIIFDSDQIVKDALGFLEQYYRDKKIQDSIEEVYVKLLGHAMPVPGIGYLFNDRNEVTKGDNFFFAGVDNGNLPLMFEALDSGICAANLINKSTKGQPL